LARIYTRTGDKGETGLVGGNRTSKGSLRVQAYGDIDELNSVLGLARTFSKDKEISSLLERLQRDLFIVGADLASPRTEDHATRVTGEMTVTLEKNIDTFQQELRPLKAFILPGGAETGALLHFARTVARRAERSIVALNKTESLNENLIPYMNRLSDLLFVMARLANHREGGNELEWHQKVTDST
jgi:cob(I)alamin adenosyltransferase